MKNEKMSFFGDYFMEPFFKDSWLTKKWDNIFDNISASNIYTTDNEYVIEYNQAGIPQEKWNIEVRDNKLYIEAENKEENQENDENKKYYKFSSNYVKISESLNLPNDIDISSISATYKDGVLKIQMKKKPNAEITKIEINN